LKGEIYVVYVVLRDAGHGLWDTPGKRTPYLSSLGRAIRENEFNEPVAQYLEDELKRQGVIVHDISPGTKDTPLTQRTNEANRLLNHYIRKYGPANVRVVLVSFHFNAFDGSFSGSNPSGISVHIQPGSSHARKLAECVGKHLRKGTKQVWRGIVEQNLHMTREFQGVGILTENGFMDHPEEAKLMLDKDYQKEVARETAEGVLEYFGLQYKPLRDPVVKPQQKEEDEVIKMAVVVYSDADLSVGYDLANEKKCGLYNRKSLANESLKINELMVVGGPTDDLKEKTNRIIDLSGKDRWDTRKKVISYLGK
jgi:N-acetylmuramoyl-L-alanine amidase